MNNQKANQPGGNPIYHPSDNNPFNLSSFGNPYN